MIRRVKELLGYRELIRNLVIRDLKVRYKNSVLGVLWSLLNPLLMTLVFTVVFTLMMPSDIDQLSGLFSVRLPAVEFSFRLVDRCDRIDRQQLEPDQESLFPPGDPAPRPRSCQISSTFWWR